ncbi:M20/M25/M40 family metallo-hydrolase, partial [Nostoc sp. CHAB 5715]|uniref:M20/M25/M40 family metallo-hydrolase n=1 Tax=Nostoc sp. CHAB 5715 TaxID=2780400 RepID=UPI001E530E25
VTPMETGQKSDLARAQEAFSRYATEIGFECVHYAPPPSDLIHAEGLPLTVFERFTEMGAEFFENQPNLVLHLGCKAGAEKTLLFNFHMDTVDGTVPVTVDNKQIFGRGVADAKGLGLAVLAGIRSAIETDPQITRQISILIQSVGGEEGGSMGFYGTRYLTELGYRGRLNMVCEPTQFRYFDQTTSSMTAKIAVDGIGSTDDEPARGHNATILLASMTDYLSCNLSPKIFSLGGKMCVAGLHTGMTHNRVFGSGVLLLNFAYTTAEIALQIKQLTEQAFKSALAAFVRDHASIFGSARTARDAYQICRLTWLKQGLPVLNNHDPEMEVVFARAGIGRHGLDSQVQPFTCDAMWLGGKGYYTVVYGPGDLGANRAHTEGEFMAIEDLDRYADSITTLIKEFVCYANK